MSLRKHPYVLILGFVVAVFTLQSNGVLQRTTSNSYDPTTRTDTAKTTQNATTTAICASLDATEFENATNGRYKATYFQGGYASSQIDPNTGLPRRSEKGANNPSWPRIFANPLKAHGWKKLDNMTECSQATFKIMRGGASAYRSDHDGRMYKQFCSQQAAEQRGDQHEYLKALTFGYDGDRQLDDKDAFEVQVRKYEKEKKNGTAFSSTNSILPLTYMLWKPPECQAFFTELETNPAMAKRNWISKTKVGFGGKGINVVSNLTQFQQTYGSCNNNGKAPLVQELIQAPLFSSGATWNYRVYMLVVNFENPLRVFSRFGDIKVCSEPYARRFDPDPKVRDQATKCNLHVAMEHPSWNKPGGLTRSSVLKPLHQLDSYLGKEKAALVMQQTDEALRSLVEAMMSLARIEPESSPDHVIGGLYAVDAMFDAVSSQVKVLEINFSPGAGFFETPSASTDESHGLPVAEDLARLAITSFHQYGLGNERFDVDACAERFAFLNKMM